MARSSMQKKKLLLVMREVLEKTDENHTISTQELVQMLEKNGISAERKSIYHDMETLREFGIDIEYRREQPSGYYVASRSFELPELKLLVDAVQCAKFITRKKSEELIHKLGKLTSVHEEKQLRRQIYVIDRVKALNESIYYNVDTIHSAMMRNLKVRFQYFKWTVSKEMELRRNGEFYEISPWALTWDDENYYMIGYDGRDRILKHYRVDKMIKTEMVRSTREGKQLFEKSGFASYSKRVFGMFGGREEKVKLVCRNELIGVMLDRFGKEIPVCRLDGDSFSVEVKVTVSQQFFGWLFALGDGVRIEAPEAVVEQFRHQADSILRQYK